MVDVVAEESLKKVVVTQEPKSLKIVVGTLEMQQEVNPEVDVIPDMDLGEDEQVQS